MQQIRDILSNLRAEARLRRLPAYTSASADDRDCVDLTSNDYLGLGKRANEFYGIFCQQCGDFQFSSSASRLLSFRQSEFFKFEQLLTEYYGRAALIFNSGYHANVGIIGALSSLPSTLFVCDKLINASVIDGLRIGSASFKRFPHNNIRKLNDILEKEYQNFDRIIIVTESIYSMDGDEAPLHQLVKLKKSFPNVMLYLDEAHALGVRGAQGLGLAEEYSAINDFDIIIGTLGKAAASVGAFAICDNEMKTYLINTARSFIFSTALPPVNILWSRIMLEQIVTMKKEREYLKELSDWFREMLLVSTGQLSHSTSQIIPLMTGNAAKAIETADKLRENGIIALPIRRPTVPPGGERLRFSLSCDIDKEKLMPVFQILKSLYHN